MPTFFLLENASLFYCLVSFFSCRLLTLQSWLTIVSLPTKANSFGKMNGHQTRRTLTLSDYHIWGVMLEHYKTFHPKPKNTDGLQKVLQLIWNQPAAIGLSQGGHKPGKPNTQRFLWTWKTQGILREFCATSGKNCNDKIFLLRHSNICVKQLVTCYIAGVDVEWLTLMNVIITFTFCCNNLWKNKFMALEKPGKLREFFSYFVATL